MITEHLSFLSFPILPWACESCWHSASFFSRTASIASRKAESGLSPQGLAHVPQKTQKQSLCRQPRLHENRHHKSIAAIQKAHARTVAASGASPHGCFCKEAAEYWSKNLRETVRGLKRRRGRLSADLFSVAARPVGSGDLQGFIMRHGLHTQFGRACVENFDGTYLVRLCNLLTLRRQQVDHNRLTLS